MLRTTLLVLLMLPSLAMAHTVYEFEGWSPDGAFYMVSGENNDGTKTFTVLAVGHGPPASWPKGLSRPSGKERSASACADMDYEGDGKNKPCSAAVIKKARKWVAAVASLTGPHGEKVAIKGTGERRSLTVSIDGKAVARSEWELDGPGDYALEIKQAYWAPNGGAVAVLYGYPEPDGDEQEGEPGPEARQVMVVELGHAAAVDANRRGMKRYEKKDWRGAAEEFRIAVAADANWPQPRYNLACVAALQKDIAGVVAQLEWLGKSTDPLAKSRLAKAMTDPDLSSVRSDPKVSQLLKAAASNPTTMPNVTAETGLTVIAWSSGADDDAERVLAKLPPPHVEPEDCDAGVLSLTAGAERIFVSYAEGIVVTDKAGRQLARDAKALGDCVGTQTRLHAVAVAQVVPDAAPQIVLSQASGGRGNWTESIQVYRRSGAKLILIFDGTTFQRDSTKGEGDGKITFASDGTISYREPFSKKTQHLRWDPAKGNFH